MLLSTPASAPPGRSRRQGTRRSRSNQGTDVHRKRPARRETGSPSSPSPGRPRSSERARYSRAISTTSAASPSSALAEVRRPPLASSLQALRYIPCMRRVRETPEKTRSTTLSTPVPVSGACAKSALTALAASPPRSNLRMMASETRSSLSVGASAETSSRSGMSAVNACAAIAMARSTPCMATNAPRQRPTNDVSSLRRMPATSRADSVPSLYELVLGPARPSHGPCRSGQGFRLEPVELGLRDGSRVQHRLGLGDLVGRGRLCGNLTAVGILPLLERLRAPHRPLGHASATDGEVDERGQDRHKDQHNNPDGPCDTGRLLVAEEVSTDVEQHHQVGREGKRDDDEPHDVPERHSRFPPS